MSGVVVTGYVGLVDERHNLITELEPCRYEWDVGDGFTIRLRSQHDVEIPSGKAAWAVLVTDEEKKLVCAYAIVARPVEGYCTMHID